MAWFKSDDKLHSHRKTRRVLRSADGKRRDAAAMGLWTLAGTWCADNLTDGFVPADELDQWDDDAELLAERLVAAGFWEPTELEGETGYQFVNWSEKQPTKQEVEANREKRAKAGRIGGIASGKTRRSKAEASASAIVEANANPDPARPVLTSSSEVAGATSDTEVESVEEVREDVEALCTRLADAIERNGSRRPTITRRWRDEARRLLDRDGRTVEEAVKVMEWAQSDSFWCTNILSMPKFRSQYDQLRLKSGQHLQSVPTQRQPDLFDDIRRMNVEGPPKGLSHEEQMQWWADLRAETSRRIKASR